MTHDARNADSNFTPLRVMLALLVLLGHFLVLGGITARPFPFMYSEAAVDCFFVASGFLISASFDRDSNLLRFYIRRIFRIYPLYGAVILAQAAILVLLEPAGAHVPAASLLRYILANAAFANFLQRNLGDGLLSTLPVATLNPSLWTLKIELGFYLILPFVWIVTRWLGWAFLGVLFIASAFYQWALNHAGHAELARQLPGQIQFFVLGIAIYRLRGRPDLPRWVAILAALGLGALLTALLPSKLPAVYPAVVAAFVAVVALKVPPLAMRTDISFGIYLLHGPVIQLSLLLGLYRADWRGLAATLVVVVALAWAAERLIETPGIALGRRLSRFVRDRGPRLPPAGARLARPAGPVTK
jgi:peptidoglycan/LPS O-acetylase OafA/YrhL